MSPSAPKGTQLQSYKDNKMTLSVHLEAMELRMGKLGIVVILLVLEQLSAIAGGKTILAVPVVCLCNDSICFTL